MTVGMPAAEKIALSAQNGTPITGTSPPNASRAAVTIAESASTSNGSRTSVVCSSADRS